MNNRIIKLRAWDKNDKKMYEVNEISFGDCLQVNVSKDLNDDFRHVISNCGEEATALLMQFTGLLDKNGKEIYEGDILADTGKIPWEKRSEIERQSTLLWVVSFDKGGFIETCRDHLLGRTAQMRDNHNHIESETEVIGDIYDNPELL